MNDTIQEILIIWRHHDEGYIIIIDCTTSEDEAIQLQLAIAKHIYLEVTCFNE